MKKENKLLLFDFGILVRKPAFVWRAAMRYVANLLSKGHFLVGVSFASTYDCNFDCSHCYAKNFRNTDKKPLSLEEKKRVIRECSRLGAVAFDFVGGEVGLSDELEALVKACKPYKSYVSLASNGYDMDEEKIRRFRKWGIDKISVSIDSFFEDEHDRFRNKLGSHKKCFRTIELCRKTGIKPAIIMTVVKDATKTESFKKMVEYAVDNRIQLIFNPAIPFGKWEENLDLLVTEEDVKEMERLHDEHPFLTRDNYTNMGKQGCPAFKQIIYVTEYGDVLPCAFAHISFGNIRQESVRSIRKKGLSIDSFSRYSKCCLAAEDREFINDRLSKNFKAEEYPVEATDVFQEMPGFTEGRKKSNIAKTSVSCALCSSDDYSTKVVGSEHEFDNTTDDEFRVVECNSCGFVYLNPRPDVSELDVIYPDNYYCHKEPVPRPGKRLAIDLSLCIAGIVVWVGHRWVLDRQAAPDPAQDIGRQPRPGL